MFSKWQAYYVEVEVQRVSMSKGFILPADEDNEILQYEYRLAARLRKMLHLDSEPGRAIDEFCPLCKNECVACVCL